MHVKQTRLARMAILLAEHGDSKAALARTLKKAPAQVSQWFNGVRTITEDTARDIERAAGRPAGWLDLPVYPDAVSTPPLQAREPSVSFLVTPEERELILHIRQITRKD